MTKTEMREKLLKLVAYHARQRLSVKNAPDSIWHYDQSVFLRQVAETMKEGWVSVPREPTDEMTVCGMCAREDGKQRYSSDQVNAVYQAMLAARPKEKE